MIITDYYTQNIYYFSKKTALMNYSNNTYKTHDGNELVTYKWDCEQPKAIIHIVHGMSEHAGRYDHFASELNNQGFLVYSSDLRGHGKTAGNLENVGQFAMEDGWNKVVKDIIGLSYRFKKENPKLPLFILGHSMGSFIARNVAYADTALADGYIYSATAGHPGLIGIIGKSVAKINMKLTGKKKRSKFMTKLAFGDFNKKYKNARTEKDWLTRDEAIIDKYMADPYSMQIFTSQFYTDLLHGVLDMNDFSNMLNLNKETPILLFAGDMDPVGNYGKGPKEVHDKMKRAGVEDVELTIFPEGRHEMLNETNKEEAYQLVFDWLNKKIK